MENDIEQEFIRRQAVALDGTICPENVRPVQQDSRYYLPGVKITTVATNINRDGETEYLEIHTMQGEKL